MDTRPQKYERDTKVIFVPLPGHKKFEHANKQGRILWKQSGTELWWIEFDEKEWINKGGPMQKEINIRVLATEQEFRVLKP